MNIKSQEQRNYLKIFNLLNFANQNKNNKDIYFYIKYIILIEIDELRFSPEEKNKLINHSNNIKTEIQNDNWDITKFDPRRYSQVISDYLNKMDFRKVDTNTLYKCKDLLEIDIIKNDLYNRRIDFFTKRLPTKFEDNNFIINQDKVYNYGKNNINQNNMNQNNNNNLPENPFAGINYASNPFGDYNANNDYLNNTNNTNNTYNTNNNNTLMNNYTNNTATNNSNPIMNNNTNYNNFNNFNNDIYNKKVIIPEDIKSKIISELKLCGDELNNGQVEKSQKHSLDAFLLFKQVFNDK